MNLTIAKGILEKITNSTNGWRHEDIPREFLIEKGIIFKKDIISYECTVCIEDKRIKLYLYTESDVLLATKTFELADPKSIKKAKETISQFHEMTQ